MRSTERIRNTRPALAAADAATWARVLSLTSTLLSQMAHSAETRRLVSDLLAAQAAREALSSPVPFDEPLSGLQTRELREPDVFSRFFGGRASA